MGRKSTLRRLQPEIQAEINRILSEGRLTLDELLEHLRGIGVEGVSRSALGRQKQKIDKIAAKLRQSREMTEALVREIGPAVEEGQQGRLLVEVLRRLVFDHLEKRLTSEDEESQDIDNQGLFFLASSPTAPMVRGLCPRDWMRGEVDARRARCGWRGQSRSGRTSASNAARRSHQRGASRTPPLTDDS